MMVVHLGATDDRLVLNVAGYARATGGDMPNDQHPSVIFHVAEPGQIPPDSLIGVEPREGQPSAIYLHPLHVRADLIQELNWLARHQVGDGLLRRSCTGDAGEGLGNTVFHWEIVPSSALPRGRTVVSLEEDGICAWSISSECCTDELCDEMNRLWGEVADDGLWSQSWYTPAWASLVVSH
jgi:hypothetical protein